MQKGVKGWSTPKKNWRCQQQNQGCIEKIWAEVTVVDILNPWIFTGLLFGARMSYAFAAWTMRSVGKAANDMVRSAWNSSRRSWARRT